MNLLNEASHSKFVTRWWNIVNDQSNPNFDAWKKITYNTDLLKSNFCNYNGAYILVGPDIGFPVNIAARAAFENCTTFTNCIIKIGLDLVIPMYNLLE